ncbi:MAG: family 43 glycosylhydrolase [Bacillota bacterium]
MENINIKDNVDLLCYTRKPKNEMIYAPKLAYSMHLAYSIDGLDYHSLNHNSGVLFALATENANGSLNAKSLKKPYIFKLDDGSFGVIAIRTEANGEKDSSSKGSVLFFTSKDLIEYNEIGLIDLKVSKFVEDLKCVYDKDKQSYFIYWRDQESNYYRSSLYDPPNDLRVSETEKIEAVELVELVETDIEGAVTRNVISLSPKIAQRLIAKLTVPINVQIDLPESVNVESEEDFKKIKATAIYNDGTTAAKTVDWNVDSIDWSISGTRTVTGTVHQDHFEFPVAINRADPCIKKWKGKYYFIATNDADDNHSLYIREADSIPELIEAEENLILDSEMYEDIKGLLWAPELHIIEDELYIFHGATSSEFFYEESHVMKLKESGNPVKAGDWSRPHRVLKKDGSYLCEAGKTISLDMTVIKNNENYYVMWSQRQFLPVDLGAWLYIARIDPAEPWKLINDPLVISKPDYGWANNHAFVDEGPFALVKDDKIFVTFASALIDATYVIGLLTIDKNSDLMNPDNWKKSNYPLLTSRSVEGEYGPGHNTFVIDENDIVWNAYHARPEIGGPRSAGIRRVHFDIDGYPVLDLTENKDLNKSLADVEIKVNIN